MTKNIIDKNKFDYISGNYNKIIECKEEDFPKQCEKDDKKVIHGYVVEFNAGKLNFTFAEFEAAFNFYKYGRQEFNIWSHGIGKCAIEIKHIKGIDKSTLYVDYTILNYVDRDKTLKANLKLITTRK